MSTAVAEMSLEVLSAEPQTVSASQQSNQDRIEVDRACRRDKQSQFQAFQEAEADYYSETVIEGQIQHMQVVSAAGERTELVVMIAGRHCKAYGETAERLLGKHKTGEYTHAEGSWQICEANLVFVLKKGYRIRPPHHGVATALGAGTTTSQETLISKAAGSSEESPQVQPAKLSDTAKESRGGDAIAVSATDSAATMKPVLAPETREKLIQQRVRWFRDPFRYPNKELEGKIQSASSFFREAARRVLAERAEQDAKMQAARRLPICQPIQIP